MTEIVDAYCTLGDERETTLSAEGLLRLMDEAGVTAAVIAPQDREIALHNESGNDRILRAAEARPDRFIPSCTVNPWHGGEGVKHLRQAVRRGARTLVLAPALQGFYLPDELADELCAAAGEMRLPVYVHTGPHSAAGPASLALLALRHPKTRFIVGHCGSTDYVHDMPAVLTEKLDNLWYELSLVRPWAMKSYGTLADESRFLFGTSAPRNDPKFELRFFNDIWPIDRHAGTYGQNLRRLLAEVRP